MYSFGVRSMGGRSEGRNDARTRGDPPASTWSVASVRPPLCVFAPLRPCAFTYSHSPSLPPSLPYPDSRYPPNPEAASNMLVQLTQTVPALSWGAMSSAVLRFSLQTLAARPYRVLLAISTDSEGVRKVISTTTGPKISTW